MAFTHPKSADGRRQFLVSGMAAVAMTSFSASALSDNRPIKMIVPFAAGSSVDIMARMVGDRIAFHLGAPVVFDNRPGAGGSVGATAAAQATPDGTNIFFGTAGTHGINPALYKKLGYDPVKDFEPVVGITRSSNVLVVNPGLGIKSLSDFVEKAKAAPGAFMMGSGGNGTTPHLSGALLNRVAGIDTTHVPYKSGAIMDVIAGRLTYSFESVPSAAPFIKSGRVQALAVTAAKREALLPDVPTIAESGFPSYEVMAWAALFAPRGTPSDFIARVNAATNKALAEPELIQRMAGVGSTPIGGSPEELRKRVATELDRWPEVIRAANISLD